jgi:hypothetical protein
VATAVETGVASQGETREVALWNLDEAVELHRGDGDDSVDSPDGERDLLRDLGLDPDEVERARDHGDELPEFMQ